MSEQANHSVETEHLDENQIMALRREKLHTLQQAGNAYPNDFRRDAFAGDLQDAYGEFDKESLAEKKVQVKVVGRMMLKRNMGKASFATIQDVSGQIQLYINNQGVGEETHEAFKHWDLGDIIACEGEVMKTNHGELTVRASSLRFPVMSLFAMGSSRSAGK